MVNAIRWDHAGTAAFTITLASLASSTAGVGRQSTLIDNSTNWYKAAKVYLSVQVGTSPTANTLIYVYLIRADDSASPTITDDSAGTSDAALTVKNAPLLGTLRCTATTSNADYEGVFDTAPLGPLGPYWGIAIVHDTGVNLNSTETNHIKKYDYYNPEVQ